MGIHFNPFGELVWKILVYTLYSVHESCSGLRTVYVVDNRTAKEALNE